MLSPWRFLWVSLTRSPSPERRSHPEKKRGRSVGDRDNFKTKIRSVTNKQKMRRGRKLRVWLWWWGGCQERWKKATEKKGREGGGEHKQANSSKTTWCLCWGWSWRNMFNERCMDKVKLRSPPAPCTLCLGRSFGSPGSKPPDACDEASWQLG